ncbi:LacI family DNA-binding transcriptional regulator [Kitasatospora indigofera]|uniref:LacI family DNA-binding transcriptional regulator n=1 Tax=Kitasatospora indigofera TaxID=67307 RepID=UPI003653E0C7
MSDVARSAGVSQTTASFVLSGRTDMRISEAAQARVKEAAKTLGYRPNVTARSLRTKVTRTIGFVSDAITTTPFAGDVIRGALDVARSHDYLLFIVESEGSASTEAAVVNALVDRQVDAVIMASMYTRYITPPKDLHGQRVVLLNCLAPGFDAPSVIPDEIGAGRAAGRLLTAAGHRTGIWAIGGHQAIPATPEGNFAGNERMRGLQEVLREERVVLDGVVECEWNAEDGYRETRALLAAGRRPRALVCSTDRLSFGAYQAIAEAGLTVPGDISVVSFDDQDIASWLHPALTTLALPHYDMGRTAMELVLGTEALGNTVHRIPMPLRNRGSVAAPRG